MASDRIFPIALLVSFLAHTAIFFYNTNFMLFRKGLKDSDTEVTYLKEEGPMPPQYQTQAIAPLLPDLPIKTNLGKDIPIPGTVSNERQTMLGRSQDRLAAAPTFVKPSFNQPETISVKRVVTLPPIDSEKINNPSYMNYYQLVREKIRRAAYRNFVKTDTGEVYLSFIVSRDGTLKESKLLEERTHANQYLKQTARKSLNEAAPFPVFPEELESYQQLSFNVIISFQMAQG